MAEQSITSQGNLYAAVRRNAEGQLWIDHTTLSDNQSDPIIAAQTRDRLQGATWAAVHKVARVEHVLLIPRADRIAASSRPDENIALRLLRGADNVLWIASGQTAVVQDLHDDGDVKPERIAAENATHTLAEMATESEEQEEQTAATPSRSIIVYYEQVDLDDTNVRMRLYAAPSSLAEVMWEKIGTRKKPNALFPGKGIATKIAQKEGWVLEPMPEAPTPTMSNEIIKAADEAVRRANEAEQLLENRSDRFSGERDTMRDMPHEVLKRIALNQVKLPEALVNACSREQLIEEILQRRHPSTQTVKRQPENNAAPNWVNVATDTEARHLLNQLDEKTLYDTAEAAQVELYESINVEEIIETLIMLRESLSLRGNPLPF